MSEESPTSRGGTGRRPEGTNRLTEKAVRAFIASARGGRAPTTKLSDGGGLYLTLTRTKSASPAWRLKYRLGGVERLFAIGIYPEISLQEARAERDRARALIREGRDPVKDRSIRRQAKLAVSDKTFAGVAGAWLELQRSHWSAVHYDKSRRAFERDVYPWLGKLPIADITRPMIVNAIRRVAKRGAIETASRVEQHIRGVFHYAIDELQLREDNPALAVTKLPPRKVVARRPALLEVDPLREVLRAADRAPISPAMRMASRLIAFTAARIGNAVDAEWAEFDLDSPTPSWVIPRAKMKVKDREHDHRILLGPTIATELRWWRKAIGTKGPVFPSDGKSGRITREGLEKVYRETLKLANTHSLHGWRASFSTIAQEAGFASEVVELTLDHIAKSEVARAYDRGERLVERRRLMDWWDAQLTGAGSGGVLALSPRDAANA